MRRVLRLMLSVQSCKTLLRVTVLLFFGAIAAEMVGPAFLRILTDWGSLPAWISGYEGDVWQGAFWWGVGRQLFAGKGVDVLFIVLGLVIFVGVARVGSGVVQGWALSKRKFKDGRSSRRKVVVMGCSPLRWGQTEARVWFSSYLKKCEDVVDLLEPYADPKACHIPAVIRLKKDYEQWCEWQAKQKEEKKRAEADKDLASKDLEPGKGDAKPITSFLWQQPCRLIYHIWQAHRVLERIIIIPPKYLTSVTQTEDDQVCSIPGRPVVTDEGKNQANELRKLIELLLERIDCKAEVTLLDHSVDYEDLEEVETAIEEARQIALSAGVSDRDICVDITAGQKTFSIAAANATLRHNIVFAYVPTNSPDNISDASVADHFRPVFFDVRPITNDAA